jgi:hypothetical protein
MVPNYFIVGAPKSGTTALSFYLQSNPNVFMCTPKEPHYFATDLPNYRSARNESEYRKLFRDCSQTDLAVGEGSVWYLYSSEAIENIYRFNPKSKIIIMLRNPVEMVHSMHSQHLYSLDEDQPDFMKAWNLQGQRKNGKYIPKHCREPKTLMYGEIAKFGFQVENVFKMFPKEQVKIILFDEFKNATRTIYDETIAFLNLPPDERKYFPKINVNKRYRVGFIAQFIRNPPYFLRKFNRSVEKLIGTNLNWRRQALRKINTKVEKRQELPKESRQEIIDTYRDDIIHLSYLINRPLDIWQE